MPQNPTQALVGVTPANLPASLKLDTEGNLVISGGGTKSALNQTAAGVIKATPGRLAKIVIVAGGTSSGAFTFNDCATTGAAAAANEIFTVAEGAAVGTVYSLDWPCLVGIVLSAVPGSGSPICSVSFD